MTTTDSVNPPKQGRSRRTLERIVRAALDILEEEGAAGLTVQAVVERAGSSVGSFYARFGGKDDLIDYLEGRIWDEALERWNEAFAARDWSMVPLAELVEASVGLLFEAQEWRSRHLLALDRVGGRQGDAYANFRRHVGDGLAALLLARSTEIVHPDPGRAVRLALRAVGGIVDTEGVADAEDRLQRDVLVDECSRLVLGYLTGQAGGAAGSGVDFFDVWG